MNIQNYIQAVKARLSDKATVLLDEQDRFIAYEEVFKWSWWATKLKITSFVKYLPTVQLSDIKSYSEHCLMQARKDRRGLPIGLQNGIMCFCVLASENISPDAIAFATSRPKKHWAAFEVPVLFDLCGGELFFFDGKIIWGSLYQKFLIEYINKHFCAV